MTLPASGQMDMLAINTEFGRGLNLNAYRGTTWYTDAGSTGTFSAGAITMNEFYGKRLTLPASYLAGASAAATTVAMPTHNIGDMIVIVAVRATAGAITVPGTYTQILTSLQSGSRFTVAYRVATATNDATGTWTGANGVMINIWRGIGSIGSSSVSYTGSGTTQTWPARTLVGSGTSWVTGLAFTGTTAAGGATPAGQTARRGANFLQCWDSNAGLASYSSQTSTVPTSQAKYACTIELRT